MPAGRQVKGVEMFDQKKFPMAVALFMTLISLVCGLLVWLAPDFLMAIIRPITHGMDWDLIWKPSVTLGGLILGLVDTFILSYILSWLFAKIFSSLK